MDAFLLSSTNLFWLGLPADDSLFFRRLRMRMNIRNVTHVQCC